MIWPNFRSMKLARSIILAESNYFPSSGVWLLLQNMISVLGCYSWEYFCFGFVSADQNNCHQLHKIMPIIKTCLKYPNISCFTNEGTGLNGERFSRTYICPWYFQTSHTCFCFLRLSQHYKKCMHHQLQHTLNTQSNANIYALLCQCKVHTELNLQFKLISKHILIHYTLSYNQIQPLS